MKKLLLTSAITSSIALSIPALAFDAEYSVGASYIEISDSGWEIESDALAVTGTWYTSPVNTKSGPLAEAAFLSKSSSISLGYAAAEADYTDDDDPDFNASADADSWAFDWRWVTSENNVILDFAYTKSDADDDFAESEILSVGIGTYLNPTNTIVLNYSKYEVEDDDLADSIGLEYRGLFGPANNMALQAGILRTELDQDLGGEDGVGAAVAFTYYVNKQLGIGVSYALDVISVNGVVAGSVSVDDIDADLYGLKVDWFAKENLRFLFEYVNGEVENIDVEGVAATMSFRF